MFIERFFNPVVSSNNECVLYSKNDAIGHCIKHFSFIRHYSFKGNQYIKYDGKCLLWNDGSKVDKRKLPKNGGWGKYFSELHNMCSF